MPERLRIPCELHSSTEAGQTRERFLDDGPRKWPVRHACPPLASYTGAKVPGLSFLTSDTSSPDKRAQHGCFDCNAR